MSTTAFKYDIIVSSDASEALMAIIAKYWLFENGHFKYSFEDLILNKNERKRLLDEILNNSKCILTFKNCLLCFSAVSIPAKNRDDFIKLSLLNCRICDTCKKYSPNYDEGTPLKQSLKASVNQLTNNELRVLSGIVKLKNKNLIYRHIFNNDIADSAVWNIINLLQRKGLIWIDRDSSWKIKSFNFESELSEII